MSDSLRPHRLYSLWTSPGQNTGVGSLSLLQGILPIQGSNPGLPHYRQILYQLSHKGSPKLEIAKLFSNGHSHQQCVGGEVVLYPYRPLVLWMVVVFLICSNGCSGPVTLICFSLLSNDVEIFSVLTVCVSSFVKYLFKSFEHLKSWFVFLFLSCESSLHVPNSSI